MDSKWEIFRVYKNMLIMLKERGYIIAESEMNMNLIEFTSFFDQELSTCSSNASDRMSFSVQKQNGETLVVFISKEEKVGIKPFKVYCEKMNQTGIYRALIVYSKTITPHAKQLIQGSNSSSGKSAKYFFECFSFQQIIDKPIDHEIVPKHRKLSDEEKDHFLKSRFLKPENLPKITVQDPISQHCQYQRDNIIEINRIGDAGPYKQYRLVVP